MPPIPEEIITYTQEDIEKAIEIFKAKKIPVYEPGEDNYERYVATANLIYRFSSPPCVVQPKCACDVRNIVKIAKPRKIPITIKNGGHSYAGGSTTNIGILMELGLMNEVVLDINKEAPTVTVQGGALWFNVYKKLVSKHLDGWIVNGGRCPTVGVSGFILGGGLSPFTRSFGMGCDTVKEFTIVTAAGDEITVSERDNPSTEKGKLFWALRGAGGGNFGVVVEMKLALKQLKSLNVVAGRYTWYPKREAMDTFMAIMNSFYTQSWSEEMTIDSSWLCELEKKESDLGVRFLVYYNGDRENFNQEIDKWKLRTEPPEHEELKLPTEPPEHEELKLPTEPPEHEELKLPIEPPEHEELKQQLKQRSLQEKSSRFLHETLAAQWIEETKKSFPTNRAYQIYTSFVFNDNPEKFAKITQIIRQEMGRFRKQFKYETGLLQVTFIHSGGAANKLKRNETAYRWRGCVYHTYIMIQWDEKWLELNMRSFLDEMKPKLNPHGMVRGATFINFPDDSLTEKAHEKSYYGMNYQELRRIKEVWDKDEFFKCKQGIRLPGTDSPQAAKIDDQNLMKDIPAAEFLVKEQALTDLLANQQWESYRPTSTDVYGNEALPELVY